MTASICRSGTRSTLPVDAISASTSARCSSSQWEPGEMAAMPSSTSAGVLGMTRTTATPSGTWDSMKRGGDAGGQRDDQLAGAQLGGDLGEQHGHVLRLDDHGDGVGLAGRLDVGDDRDAVALLELAGALGPLLADQQVVDAAPGAHQPGEQGLAHHAGTEDGRLLHGAPYYDLEISDFRKNDRLDGFSARRLMR